MAPHAEPSPPPSPNSNKSFESKQEQPSHSRFLAHLTTYPILSDSFQLFSSRAPNVIKSTLTFTNSVTRKFIPNPESSKILSQADNIGDRLLTRIDHQFPALHKDTKTLYKDVTSRPRKVKERLVDQPLDRVVTARNTYVTAIKTRTSEAISNFKENISRIQKEQIEPAIGKYTDPYVGPFNDRFADELDRRFPKSYREALFETSPTQERDADGIANDDLETKWAEESQNKIELYRTLRLARSARLRIDARLMKPARDDFYARIQALRDFQLRTIGKAAELAVGVVTGVKNKVQSGVDEVTKIWQEERGEEANGGESMDNHEKTVGVTGYVRAGSRVGKRVALKAMQEARSLAVVSLAYVRGTTKVKKEKTS